MPSLAKNGQTAAGDASPSGTILPAARQRLTDRSGGANFGFALAGTTSGEGYSMPRKSPKMQAATQSGL
jgi:hypothetical protein